LRCNRSWLAWEKPLMEIRRIERQVRQYFMRLFEQLN
jgi:hypothetical protein